MGLQPARGGLSYLLSTQENTHVPKRPPRCLQGRRKHPCRPKARNVQHPRSQTGTDSRSPDFDLHPAQRKKWAWLCRQNSEGPGRPSRPVSLS